MVASLIRRAFLPTCTGGPARPLADVTDTGREAGEGREMVAAIEARPGRPAARFTRADGPRPSDGVAPAPAVPGNQRLRLGWAPGGCLVQGDRPPVTGPVPHHRIDDAPGPADLVRADEKGRIADQRVQDDALVGVRRLLLE